jgi:hypothetical protein
VHQVGILDNWRDPQKMPGETPLAQTPAKTKEPVSQMLSAE